MQKQAYQGLCVWADRINACNNNAHLQNNSLFQQADNNKNFLEVLLLMIWKENNELHFFLYVR